MFVEVARYEHLCAGPSLLTVATNLMMDRNGGAPDLQNGHIKLQFVTHKARRRKIASDVDRGRTPTLVPDGLVPGKSQMIPELLIHTVQDVEVGREISGAGYVAIAELQLARGCEYTCHRFTFSTRRGRDLQVDFGQENLGKQEAWWVTVGRQGIDGSPLGLTMSKHHLPGPYQGE